jgi:hypothetical protein
MRSINILCLFLFITLICKAQQYLVDSIKEQSESDSIETEQQLKDIKEMSRETDSLFKVQLERISEANKKQDSISRANNLKALIAQKQAEEEKTKELIIKTILFVTLLGTIIFSFYRRKKKK